MSGLIYYSKRGDYENVKQLLNRYDSSRFINKRDKYGNTALYLASKYGHTDVVKLLLSYEADPNVFVGNYDKTALTCAIEYQYSEIVRLLLENNADINMEKFEIYDYLDCNCGEGAGCSCYDSECEECSTGSYDPGPCECVMIRKTKKIANLKLAKQNKDIIKLLLEHNADPNKNNILADAAFIFEDIEMVELLLKYHADPNKIKINIDKYMSIDRKAYLNELKNIVRKAYLNELTMEVINDSGEITTVFPFPIAGGHIQLFKLLTEYLH